MALTGLCNRSSTCAGSGMALPERCRRRKADRLMGTAAALEVVSGPTAGPRTIL
jgi:hypothetical protein